jgi:hypothetical protein
MPDTPITRLVAERDEPLRESARDRFPAYGARCARAAPTTSSGFCAARGDDAAVGGVRRERAGGGQGRSSEGLVGGPPFQVWSSSPRIRGRSLVVDGASGAVGAATRQPTRP